MTGKYFSTEDYEAFTSQIGMFHGKTNVGILTDGSSVYCIDTGNTDGDGESLCKCIGELFPGKEIKVLLNTHSHADHCGANDAVVPHLQRYFGG